MAVVSIDLDKANLSMESDKTLFFFFFCTERRLLWLARPGRKALARQAFFGEGREPEIKFNRGLSTAARCCPRLLHLKETWQPRYRQPQAGVSA